MCKPHRPENGHSAMDPSTTPGLPGLRNGLYRLPYRGFKGHFGESKPVRKKILFKTKTCLCVCLWFVFVFLLVMSFFIMFFKQGFDGDGPCLQGYFKSAYGALKDHGHSKAFGRR